MRRPFPNLHFSTPDELETFELGSTREALVADACSRVSDCARLVARTLIVARHKLENTDGCLDQDLRRTLDSGEEAAHCIREITGELLRALDLDPQSQP